MKRKLKLYVWENVLKDWSYGIMFAFAYSADHARELILLKEGQLASVVQDLKAEPQVVEAPEAFVIWGGS